MFLWFLRIHTESCLASTFSCVEQMGRSQLKLDGTEFVQKADSTLVHLSGCVPFLNWHTEASVFCLWGLFAVFFLDSLLVLWNWT